MYIVSVLSQNADFLESLRGSLLSYSSRNLKFYFFTDPEQLKEQFLQTGTPDLLLCDRHLDIGESLDSKELNKVYLSEQGSSKDELFIYMNTEDFLSEVQRKISIRSSMFQSAAKKTSQSKERKITWFMDTNESDWGKQCYNNWIETRYKKGQRAVCLDFSRMGVYGWNAQHGNEIRLSDLLFEWFHKGKISMMDYELSDFDVIGSINHPMDLEMLQPEFIMHLMGQIGENYEEICLYSSICSETVAKTLLRFTEEIFILSDQKDVYEGAVYQIEAWIKELDPRDHLSVFHTRSDPNRREELSRLIQSRALEKGITL